MRLIITRHWITAQNKNRIFQWRMDSELSEEWIEQARKLATRLKDTKIDTIYSSNFKRTKNTALEVLKYHPDLELQIDERLMERDFWELLGKPVPPDFDWNNLPDFFETDEAMCLRVKDFLDEIYEKNRSNTVLIVCHAWVKLAFLTIVHGGNFSKFQEFWRMRNTGVTICDIEEDGKHKVHIIDCVEHLN